MSTEESRRDTTEQLLQDRKVFDIDHYGWWDGDEVDQAFLGYAIWQTSPPYEHDFDAWQRNARPRRPPSQKERILMECGHDFFGLMKTARHFIGQALEEQPHVRPIRIDPTRFDFVEFAALAALVAAADRLRDFLIVAVLDMKTEARTQLDEVYQAIAAGGFGERAAQLRSLAAPLNKTLRAARHTALHGLSTRPAQVQRDLIGMDKRAFEVHSYKEADESGLSFQEMIRRGTEADQHEQGAVERRAAALCEWYVGLVDIGGRNFELEYDWRRRVGESR